MDPRQLKLSNSELKCTPSKATFWDLAMSFGALSIGPSSTGLSSDFWLQGLQQYILEI